MKGHFASCKAPGMCPTCHSFESALVVMKKSQICYGLLFIRERVLDFM